MFELTKDELSRCQIGTLKTSRGSNFKYMLFSFTELGVAMLSSVLHSETAIEVNRGIMRAFVAVRQMIALPMSTNIAQPEYDIKKLKEYVEDVLTDQNEINEDTTMRLELIGQSLAELHAGNNEKRSERPRIGFKV